MYSVQSINIVIMKPRFILLILTFIVVLINNSYAQPDLKISSATSEIISGSGTFDLGDVMPGSLSGYYFIIENVGDADLTFASSSALSFGGTNPGDFSTTADLDDLTVSPGDLVVFDVTFTPSTTGARSTIVSLSSDDPDEDPYTFTVTVNSIASPGPCTIMTGDFENSYIASLPQLDLMTFETGGITEFEAPSGWSSLTGVLLALFGTDLNVGITSDSRNGSGALELISNTDGLGEVVALFPCSTSEQATLRGYYKYTGDPSEEAYITISTAPSNQTVQNTSQMTINSEASSYTMFEMDFPYYGDAEGTLMVQLSTTFNGGNATFILDDLEIITTPTVAAPPGQPAPVTFSSPTATSVMVNWTAPFDFGSTITGFSLEQKEDGGSYSEIYSGTNTFFDATSLTTGTTYFFRVKAINAEGDSPFSDEVDFTPQNIIVMSDDNVSSCDAVFTDSGGGDNDYSNSEDYVLTISPNEVDKVIEVDFQGTFNIENNFDYLEVHDGLSTSDASLGSFTGTTITSPLTATNGDGALTFHFTSDGFVSQSGWEAMISCVTPSASTPDQPDAPTFGTITSSSIVVNWTAPDDNGSTITSYTLEQKEGSGGTFSEIFSGDALTHTATSLNPATQYFFRVLATNGEGDSPFSSEASETTISSFNPFITTWQTDNPGTSGNNQITIPTTGSGYDYDISWEEVGNPGNSGVEPSGQTGNYTITFPSPGTYKVNITGDFPRIYFNYSADREKILTVEQWGDITWTSMEDAFNGCSNLTVPALDQPDLIAVTNMTGMFASAESFNQDIGNWDVSNVTNMDNLFSGASSFNQDISNWDVSSVTSMRYMFQNARAFNLPIGDWDVSNVTTMEGMFRDGSGGTNSNFNQEIGNWEVGNVTDMLAMFEGAGAFNKNINGWDVSSVTSMARMFGGAISFNQSLSNWVVTSVTEMANMFNGASAFNQNIMAWNVGNVTTMSFMFNGASAFNQNISGWDVSDVTDMKYMFNDANSFDQNLGGWDVSNVTDMFQMLSASGLSTDSYDNTLIGWDGLSSLQSNVNLGASQLEYCNGASARQSLIDSYNWNITGDQTANSIWYEDSDGDGFGNSAVSLSQCDQPVGYVSNSLDCDDTDENLSEETDWFADIDGDGYGNPSSIITQCNQPAGYVSDNTDCDDNDPNKNSETIWYEDSDGDGYGNPEMSQNQCTQPLGYVQNNMDCDDEDIFQNPELVWYADSDGDFYGDPNVTLTQCEQPIGYILNSDDCDDSDSAISPSTPWYQDSDGDGYGNPNVIVNQCQQPAGYVSNSSDCNDQNGSTFLPSTWYADADGDGYGDVSVTQSSCSQPTGYVSDNTDCDDSNADLNPGTTWYFDSDGDSYGDLNNTLIQCSQPSGYVANNNDCDDSDQNVYPGAPALPDGKDNDCDGVIDKLSQEITFNGIAEKTQGDSPFVLSATSSSNLTVDFTVVSGPVSISGNEVTITGAGQVTISASQPGNEGYNPAENVEQTFCVNPPQPVISASGLGTPNVSLDIGETYPRRWYLDNVEMFSGALQTGSLSISQEGTYTVETEVDGCLSELSSDFSLIITDLSSGLDHDLSMYPNPVYDYLNIMAPMDLTGNVSLRVIDANGIIHKKTTLQPGLNTLDLGSYAPGIYLIQVEQENQITNYRIKKN